MDSHPVGPTSPQNKAAMMPITQEAETIVSGDRMAAYGKPEDNFEHIAKIWTAILAKNQDVLVTAEDVAAMMIGLKIARQMNSNKRDNLIDIIGFTLCWERIAFQPKDLI